MAMNQRQVLRRMKERAAAHGHPVWWVLAGIVVGVGGTAAALWRNADDEPRTALGVRVPGYLGTLVHRSPLWTRRPFDVCTRSAGRGSRVDGG